MKPLGLNEIREKFLVFFESKQHLRLPSFSLVPENDPSILLINAGMTPLKSYFTGAETPPSTRITTCQKCIRTPDIEQVGFTARHGTYFEMLGNFSFGDYFKEEIINWAWEFCTKVLEMPEDRLYPSVYEEDDEAFAIWRDKIGLPESRITRLGKADNFWEHGVGPCGPCSEIYFDRGIEYGCDSPECKVGCECDRFVEFWNLVFTQFNRLEDGSYVPLEKKNIDTGAGLERFACIMQGVDNLFEVDTIRKILNTVCEKAKVNYGEDAKKDIAVRVITDHVRSTTMMISDGVLPSNEGRGYVLRRLLRRACRYGRLLGIQDLFLIDIAKVVIEQNQEAYPALQDKQSHILLVIQKEEEAFSKTVEQGLNILTQFINSVKNMTNPDGAEDVSKETVEAMIKSSLLKGEAATLPGLLAFKLHDTYGFPLDLTREIAKEADLVVDEQGFWVAMEAQKQAARQAMKKKSASAWSGQQLPEELLQDKTPTFFGGEQEYTLESKILYILKENPEGEIELVKEATAGDLVSVIFDKTPFYASSGGQNTDIGIIFSDTSKGEILDVIKDASLKFIHQIAVEEGRLEEGGNYTLQIDTKRRLSTAKNHTTTHLLQKALRIVLGDHVEQAGSFVDEEKLRFDFTHFQPLSPKQIEEVEEQVNQWIFADLPVNCQEMPIEEARKLGAMALFGEKYGDVVRVVAVEKELQVVSLEFCGGTHLPSTGLAGQFRLLSESGVASGVRRIEGVTGEAAYKLGKKQGALVEQICGLVKISEDQLLRKVETLLSNLRDLDKQFNEVKNKAALHLAKELAEQAVKMAGQKVVIARVDLEDADKLRLLGDQIRDQLQGGIVVLVGQAKDKLLFVAMADSQAVGDGFHAGNVVKAAAQASGGGGGGRPDMAQAGGKDISKLQVALQVMEETIKKQLMKD